MNVCYTVVSKLNTLGYCGLLLSIVRGKVQELLVSFIAL